MVFVMDQLLDYLKDTNEELLIQTHDFPDYDALASAFGLQKLLQKLKVRCRIIYQGKILSHVQTRFLDVLHIKLTNAAELSERVLKKPLFVVDTTPNAGNIRLANDRCIGFIDHHRSEKRVRKKDYVYHNRIIIGSTSTLIAQLYQKYEVPIAKNVASALAVGLLTDTLFLSRGVKKTDLNMYYYLLQRFDPHYVYSAARNKLRQEDLIHYQKAISSIQIESNVSLVVTKDVEDKNVLGVMGDFFLSLSEVNINILVNSLDSGTYVSVRSEDPLVSAITVVWKIIGANGKGGGHSYMAAGFTPEKVTDEYLHTIHHNFNDIFRV